MRTLIYVKLFGVLAVFAVLFSILIGEPVRAATNITIIAASNATAAEKAEATYVCTGTNDQTILNSVSGNVQLSSGTFHIDGIWNLAANSTYLGSGVGITFIQFYNKGDRIYIQNVSNAQLGNFSMTGTGGITLAATNGNYQDFNIHDIYSTCTGVGAVFYIYVNGTYNLSNITYANCTAYAPDGSGFQVDGAGATPTVNNLTYYKCYVFNAGVAPTRTTIWAVGFDFAEYSGLTVNGLQAIDCSVNGAWESDFHMEDVPTKENFVITGCSATNAGQKPDPTYGYGYLIGCVPNGTGDIIEYNNTASNDTGGDLDLDAIAHTPMIDCISPSNSLKTATDINQGNCSGVIVNLDPTHKELVLYSNNGSAVDQTINLGGYYAADDGNNYTFNGESIVVQFNNYAVIGLVKTTTQITTSSLPNGTVGVAYSQTLAATGGMAPYTWALASGTLPAGLRLSYSGVISGTPTTAGGPTSITFQVTNNVGTSATISLSITINAPLSITTSSLPNGTVGVAYSQTLAAIGRTPTYTWAVASGTLPAGLKLSASGVISGSPTTAGGPTFITFHVTDNVGTLATKSLSITINSTYAHTRRRYRSN